MELLNLIKGNEQRRVEKAWARYAALLAAGSADKQAVAELEECMRLLGKSAGDAEADAKTLSAAKLLEEKIHQGADIDAETEKIMAERKAYHRETEELMNARQLRHEELNAAYNRLLSRQQSARQAGFQLAELKQAHPGLFSQT